MRKSTASIVAVIVATISLASTASASQTRAWHGERTQATYNGFWLQSTLPTLYSRWTDRTEDKINWEFWHFINNDTSNSWVEMGYHNGYGYDSSGNVTTTTNYNGLFVAKATPTSFTLIPLTSKGWSYGQTHTMGTDFYAGYLGSTLTNLVDMRADNTVVATFSDVTPAARIDAGVEFGQNPILPSTSAKQSITTPSSMDSLSVRSGSTWTTWAASGKTISSFNLDQGIWYTPPVVSWDATNNKIKYN